MIYHMKKTNGIMNIVSGKLKAAVLILSAVLIFAIPEISSAIPSRPSPPRLVNDLAGLMTAGQAETLERTLVAFDDTTSNQIAVVTTPDLEGYDIAEYATRIGLDWQVGSERFDNGIVMVVKPKTADSRGQVFIAIGYGLEGAIPDAYASRIIDQVIIPHFMENDYAGGIAAGCDILMKLASGEISELREEEEDEMLIVFIVFFLIIAFVIIVAISAADDNNRNGGRGGHGPIIITGGSGFGGWGSSGGSFGGGSFGGFGGFGGGSFGGGGAGGSW